MCTIKQHPGKFEGESCITHLAHEWMMNGAQDDTEWDEMDLPTEIFNGPFNLSPLDTGMLCLECHNDLLKAKSVSLWEDTNGFAYSEVR